MKIVIFILFLFILIFFGLLSRHFTAQEVESDLKREAREALANPEFHGVNVDFDHMDCHLSGIVASEDLKNQAEALVKEMLPAGRIRTNDIAIAGESTVSPSPSSSAEFTANDATLTVAKSKTGIIVSGQVPTVEAEAALREALDDIDNVSYSLETNTSMATPTWMEGMITFLPTFLANTAEGFAGIDDKRLLLSGDVTSADIRDNLFSAASDIKIGKRIIENKLNVFANRGATATPSYPTKLSVVRDGKQVIVTGTLQTDAQNQAVETVLRETHPDFGIINRINIRKDAAPTDWAYRLSELNTKFLEDTQDGRLEIDDRGIILKGSVADMNTRLNIARTHETFLQSDRVTNLLTIVASKRPAFAALIHGDKAVTLEGRVPNNAIRKSLLQAVSEALPNTKIKDSLLVSNRVIDSEWIEKAEDALVIIGNSGPQTGIAFDGSTIRLSGTVASKTLLSNTEKEMAALFGDAFTIENQLEIGKITTKPVKQANVSEAPPEAAPLSMNDGALPVPPPPGGSSLTLDSAPSLSLDNPPILADPEIVTEPKIELKPTVDSSKPKENQPTIRKAKPSDWQPVSLTSDLPMDEMKKQLRAKMKLYPIFFDTNSSKIKATELPKIKSLSKMMVDLETSFDIAVIGGADNTSGSAETNKILSQKRALAVKEALTTIGIKNKTLETSIKENPASYTGDNAWKGRRVDVTISP